MILFAVPTIPFVAFAGYSIFNNSSNEKKTDLDSDQGRQADVNSNEEPERSDASKEFDSVKDCKGKNNRTANRGGRGKRYPINPARINNCLLEALIRAENPGITSEECRKKAELARIDIVEGTDLGYRYRQQLYFDGPTLHRITNSLGINSHVVVQGPRSNSGVIKYFNPDAKNDHTVYIGNENYNHFVAKKPPSVPVEPHVVVYPNDPELYPVNRDFQVNDTQYSESDINESDRQRLELMELIEAIEVSRSQFEEEQLRDLQAQTVP